MPIEVTVPTRTHTTLRSPIGPLTLVAADGVLCGLYMDTDRHRQAPEAVGRAEAGALPEVAEQLGEYFAGERTAFDVDVDAPGSPFQRRVWAALRTIPYGATATYGEVAARIGRPGAARAVGLANGANPVSIIVPCHRVIGAGGRLTGYGGGLARKEALLALERSRRQPRLAL